MAPSEMIFHRRVRVLEHAAVMTVAEASQVFGVSRETIHAWKRLGEPYWTRRVDAQVASSAGDAECDPDVSRRGAVGQSGGAPDAGTGRDAEVLAELHRRRLDRLTQLRAEIDSWPVTHNTRRANHSDIAFPSRSRRGPERSTTTVARFSDRGRQ